MEPIEMFTAGILFIGAIHLAATAGSSIQRWLDARLPEKKRSQGQRSDWYVFFHCSDLTGKAAPQEKPPARRDSVVAGKKSVQQPRRLALRA